MPILTNKTLKHVSSREWSFYKDKCLRKNCGGNYLIIYNDITCYKCGHHPPPDPKLLKEIKI